MALANSEWRRESKALLATCSSRRIFQAEGLRLVIIGEGFRKTSPGGDRAQSLLCGLRIHVVLELVEEAAFRRRVARSLLQHSAHMRGQRHLAEQRPRKDLLALVCSRIRKAPA